jgi:hypothetical protein
MMAELEVHAPPSRIVRHIVYRFEPVSMMNEPLATHYNLAICAALLSLKNLKRPQNASDGEPLKMSDNQSQEALSRPRSLQ